MPSRTIVAALSVFLCSAAGASAQTLSLQFHDGQVKLVAENDEHLQTDVYARAFRDQLERVKPAPKVPEWERIANELRLVTERAVHGELSVDQAAHELDARADAILEKRRWMLARGAVH